MMALLLLNLSCAVQIKDFQYCSPVPGNLGATCDQFLTANQQILDEAQWQALQLAWIQSGQAIECTQSQTVADLKAEVEKLCSKTLCTYATAQAVRAVVSGLDRILLAGQMSRFRAQ